MGGVLQGFAVIGSLIALGAILAQVGVLGGDSARMLSRLVFFVATPCLLITLLADADVVHVLSTTLLVSALPVVIVACVYAFVARLWWKRDGGHTMVGVLCSAYVNAGNLGIPIAVYALGDASAIAPMLLLQLLVFSPIALSVLDTIARGHRFAPHRMVLSVVRNPITLAALGGLALAALDLELPAFVGQPVELLAGMAVPGMLLAYGVSLRLGPRIGTGGSAAEVATICALKLVVQPLLAYLLGRFAFGLEGNALLSLTIIAALPTAQNIFVYATRYERSPLLARDTIAFTTALSVPVLLGIAAVLN